MPHFRIRTLMIVAGRLALALIPMITAARWLDAHNAWFTIGPITVRLQDSESDPCLE